MTEHYGVPVILHSDHCAKKILPWFDGMLGADQKYFAEHGKPLWSSYMLDLSEEPMEKNVAGLAFLTVIKAGIIWKGEMWLLHASRTAHGRLLRESVRLLSVLGRDWWRNHRLFRALPAV